MSETATEQAVVTLGIFDEWWTARGREGAESENTQSVLDRGVDALRTELLGIDPSLRIVERGVETLPNVLVEGSPEAVEKLLSSQWASVYAAMKRPDKITVVTFNPPQS